MQPFIISWYVLRHRPDFDFKGNKMGKIQVAVILLLVVSLSPEYDSVALSFLAISPVGLHTYIAS